MHVGVRARVAASTPAQVAIFFFFNILAHKNFPPFSPKLAFSRSGCRTLLLVHKICSPILAQTCSLLTREPESVNGGTPSILRHRKGRRALPEPCRRRRQKLCRP